jgi:hypothetical protein
MPFANRELVSVEALVDRTRRLVELSYAKIDVTLRHIEAAREAIARSKQTLSRSARFTTVADLRPAPDRR